MNRLVGDLLLLARADAGRVGRRAECDLALIASEALRRSARSPTVTGSPAPSSTPPRSPAIRTSFIAWSSTCSRTRSATPRRATAIDLALERGGRSRPPAGQRRRPGPAGGMESQVFDRFVRGQGPADRTSRHGTGTGLGLSIVRAVAVAHGGAVTARPERVRVAPPSTSRCRCRAPEKFERTLPRLEDSFRSEAEYLPWTRQQPSRSSPIFDRGGN